MVMRSFVVTFYYGEAKKFETRFYDTRLDHRISKLKLIFVLSCDMYNLVVFGLDFTDFGLQYFPPLNYF